MNGGGGEEQTRAILAQGVCLFFADLSSGLPQDSDPATAHCKTLAGALAFGACTDLLARPGKSQLLRL